MIKSATIITITVSLLLFTGCEISGNESGSDVLVFTGATIFDGNGNAFDNGVIIVKNGRISVVGSQETDIPANARIVDVTGKFMLPGLVDAHVHYFQTGFFDSRPDALDLRDTISYLKVQAFQRKYPERYHEAYLRSGVTAVYDVGGFLWSIGLQETAENDLNAPHVAASGPLITPAPRSMINIFNTPGEMVMIHLDSEQTARQVVEQNSSLGSTGIKLWALAPQDLEDMSNLLALSDEIQKRKNRLIVHATRLEAAKAAIELGAKLLVHSVTDKVIDDEFVSLMIDNKTIITPTLVVSGGYLKTRKAILGEEMKLADPNNVVDEASKSLIENATAFQKYTDMVALEKRIERMERFIAREDSVMMTNLRILYDAGALIAVGTDAGNPGTLPGISIYDELEKMQEAGIPAADLIVMATRNGAMAMERLNDFGTIENGKIADMIILQNDPSTDISNMRSVTHVVRGGLLRPVNQKFE